MVRFFFNGVSLVAMAYIGSMHWILISFVNRLEHLGKRLIDKGCSSGRGVELQLSSVLFLEKLPGPPSQGSRRDRNEQQQDEPRFLLVQNFSVLSPVQA